MAVYQISKIQIRRGKANSGVEFPQLASGEMGWAIDTQELFIGNGSVSEGAPLVGNTKILTIHDDLLSTGTYSYKITTAGMITGLTSNAPIYRSLQTRLDDRVNVADFGAIGDGMADDSDAINRAIAQLFSNLTNPAYEYARSRTVLEFPAGTYNITKTIIVPSYATIIGCGIDKTIINYSGVGVALQCRTDDKESALINTQPRYIKISGLTINTDATAATCVDLSNVCNSEFTDLKIVAVVFGTLDLHVGVLLNSVTEVSVNDNKFKNIIIKNFYYGISNDQYAFNNMFDSVSILETIYGVLLGNIALSSQNQLINFRFENIENLGIYIKHGIQNRITNCYLTTVGTTTPQIYFANPENECINLISNRSAAQLDGSIVTQYYPELAGYFSYSSTVFKFDLLHHSGVTSPLFRLPLNTSILGQVTTPVSYTVNYTYVSDKVDLTRTGTLNIIASSTDSTISDEFSAIGAYISNWESYLDLSFSVSILHNTILISSTNIIPDDTGTITYSYTAKS